MKKIIGLSLFVVTFLGSIKGIATPVLYAQDVVGFSLSLGVEANDYSTESMGFGVRFSGDYRFGESLSIGTSSLLCSDGGFSTLEFSGNMRYYFFRDEASLIKHYNRASIFHFFLQAEGGAAVFFREGNSPQSRLMAGIAAGSRIALGRFSSLYIEPYLRFGYPYIVSIGVLGVYRFPIKGVFW
jgi:hypothetical protein